MVEVYERGGKSVIAVSVFHIKITFFSRNIVINTEHKPAEG